MHPKPAAEEAAASSFMASSPAIARRPESAGLRWTPKSGTAEGDEAVGFVREHENGISRERWGGAGVGPGDEEESGPVGFLSRFGWEHDLPFRNGGTDGTSRPPPASRPWLPEHRLRPPDIGSIRGLQVRRQRPWAGSPY